jgi:type I restriction enzyme R subunit
MKEDHISQVPALQLLQNLGYTYLTPGEAMELRGGRSANVILDGILEPWLRESNSFRHKGEDHAFSEASVAGAVQALKDVVYDGLVTTSEKVYNLLTLGKSFQQSIMGDLKSFDISYVDWERPERNVYHVTEEFSVARKGSTEHYRPDVVLFVNGIPFCVIECKRPVLSHQKDPIEEAISQHIRNQKDEGIPHLFLYSQLTLAVSKNEAKYATTGTPKKFWAVWQEQVFKDDVVTEAINRPLSPARKERLFSARYKYVRAHFDALEAHGGRQVTDQDRAIYGLCKPERLIELAYRYIVYDSGEKKVARYQQYFCVKRLMKRIRTRDRDGHRRGGVVWHTQGSGKSLTMVMLAKAISLDPSIREYKIVLVTDRIDLDDQIYKTFTNCGKDVVQAKRGSHLLELLEGPKQRIITTVLNKFEAAVGRKGKPVEGDDIFVLVDEGHRSQTGTFHAKMRRALPHACYIGFTGTPVMKKDRNTVDRFGGIIDTYSIHQAVKDKAVVPLLYEWRHVEQMVDSVAMDSWFDKITGSLSDDQVADIKKKFATTDQLNKARQKVMRIAWDISEHYRDTWHDTPLKAQLVTQDKATALLYKEYLDEFDMVTSEVLISGPDTREGEEDIYKENKDRVVRFWKNMMTRFGTEDAYNKQIINAFKKSETPEIIIVVDKLLTGFDAPKNTVLYLTRKLKEHTLLQAIARVNRLHEGKDFGYIIDYRGILENLDEALDLYNALEGKFEEGDLAGTLTDVSQEVETLPQKHSALRDVFKEIGNKYDEEAYETHLADEARRLQFYERFAAFARALQIALSTVKFLEDTPQQKVDDYRTDLKFFKNLRAAVRRRFAEVVDFSEYEPKIQKLIDTHVGTGEVEQVTGQVNIFDQDAFEEELSKITGDAARADTIAHRTMRTIEERMAEDPAFYKKFSEMLRDVIAAFRLEKMKAAEYLKKAGEIRTAIINRTGDEVPEPLRDHEAARAYYGSICDVMIAGGKANDGKPPWATEAALAIDDIIMAMRIVDWVTNVDVQNQMRNRIEDCLFETQEKHGAQLNFDDIDNIMDQCIEIAKVRVP